MTEPTIPTVEQFVEALLAMREPPYCCPHVRMERKVCGYCERETDHEVGMWPEDPLAGRQIIPVDRRIDNCLHCGNSHVRKWSSHDPMVFPKRGEPYPPPYLVRSA